METARYQGRGENPDLTGLEDLKHCVLQSSKGLDCWTLLPRPLLGIPIPNAFTMASGGEAVAGVGRHQDNLGEAQ